MKTETENYFAEVRTSYTDEDNLTHIDAYETDNDNEEGKTIAVVDRDTKKVIFFDNRYRLYGQIQEAIKEIISDIEQP